MITCKEELAQLSAEDVRLLCRRGEWQKPTAGLAHGYTQANLAILPRELAFDFLRFCLRNPRPCPLLEVTDTGSPVPQLTAPKADLRTDLPRYRIYRHGELVEETTQIRDYWRADLVAFLLGCSFTFEEPLLEAGIPVRHLEQGSNVSMYVTNRQCQPAGMFAGPLVVSMRPIPVTRVVDAIKITNRYPAVHGAPIQVGAPEQLGISNLQQPDFGDPVAVRADEVPVFWACGVTPQAVAMQVKPELMITHAPGHMFISDQRNTAYRFD